jgi:hypothetical protein
MTEFPPNLKAAFQKIAVSGEAIADRPLIVGGFVRDWLLGVAIEEVHDFDVICEQGKTIDLVNDLSQRFGLGAPVKYDYTGTSRLLIDGYSFEFQDPQNPHVHFPIENELMEMGIKPTFLAKNIFERDFTVDCLCYDVASNKVLDITNMGVDDLLKNKVIRTPIEARKAVEFNPIIILRMIRFMIEYGLEPVPELEQSIPFGVSLMPRASQERSEKFIKKLVTQTFDLDYDLATELYTRFNLWGNVPMSKELMDRKVKSDMGIKFQAMSVTVNPADNSMTFGIFKSQLNEPKYRVAVQEAIADLYINDAVNEETRMVFLGGEALSMSGFSDVKNRMEYNSLKQAQRAYPGNPVNSFRLYERYQRRHEYRQRKRREQSRDRVGKIKSWRDFRSLVGR